MFATELLRRDRDPPTDKVDSRAKVLRRGNDPIVALMMRINWISTFGIYNDFAAIEAAHPAEIACKINEVTDSMSA